MTIDAFATGPHYLAHIAPIWNQLPTHLRGTFYISSPLHQEVHRYGITAVQSAVRTAGPPVLVASYSDYRSCGRRKVIFVEHGAGQTYDGIQSGAYSGGTGRDRCILFICPSTRVADNNRARYPYIPTAIVGCPRIDHLHHLRTISRPINTPSLVVITFHAEYNVAPETHSAFRSFHPAIPALLAAGYQVLGHGHPRAYRRLLSIYSRYNIPVTPDPDEALSRADCLVVDNSSIGFEAASLNIPLVWLSPPFYRRHIRQPPRFWDALILGEEATDPSQVPAAVTRALQPISPSTRILRDRFLSTVYDYRDDQASSRAAEAIVRLMDEREQVAI